MVYSYWLDKAVGHISDVMFSEFVIIHGMFGCKLSVSPPVPSIFIGQKCDYRFSQPWKGNISFSELGPLLTLYDTQV